MYINGLPHSAQLPTRCDI